MDNYFIADQFSMLAKLMDIHGENNFRAKSYSIAAYNIEQLKDPLPEMDRNSIAAQKGIGDSTAKKILEILARWRVTQVKYNVYMYEIHMCIQNTHTPSKVYCDVHLHQVKYMCIYPALTIYIHT